ncbi:MAG: hypothetical protein B5766_06160 [Candidatus Lumbricidophila eiseniae]|uniref:DUF308 domain-containing protein n=1 Tax=Candidatus Lumbricidiphila eiseniae TaxID=1969409 RepID=A0A2A6FR92_9MICO|nr:MAG: hypothetical protein B5766_06160 [Candidatus Lumbricidophila eiseniae]
MIDEKTATARAGDTHTVEVPSWVTLVVRGGIAVVPPLILTFSRVSDDTDGQRWLSLGLFAFGIWAVVSGLVGGALALGSAAARGIRSLIMTSAVVSVTVGTVALTLPGGEHFFVVFVGLWAGVVGGLECVIGYLRRGVSRDAFVVGGCTLLLAVIFCAVPCGPLTAVGLVTAYFAIVGVIQLIGGLSVRWATERIGVT